MGALRQPKLTEPKKPPAAETRKLDQYGRDPESLPEKLRTQTGYSPFYHAWNADIPRLLGPSAVARDLISQVNRLSLGRSRESKEPRYEWSSPVSAAELAELCACNVRDIQRQLKELEERGVISVKVVKNGNVKYVISLLHHEWQKLENYAVWKRRQVKPISNPEADEELDDDEEQKPISKDAIHLFKKPASVRPGKASRAAKVNVGVREVVCQNDSSTVDAAFSAVVQSGRLVVSATFQTAQTEGKGEDKANDTRHPCRALPADEGKVNTGSVAANPRAQEIISLFDPLLQKYGAFPLLKFDTAGVERACKELGNMPTEVLRAYVDQPKGRCSRAITTAAVAGIIKDARLHWIESAKQRNKVRMSDIKRFESILQNPRESEIEHLDHVRELLAQLKSELEPES